MESKTTPFDKQIFVCTNQNDDKKPCCGNHNAQEIFKQLRAIAKERGLHPKIRVAQAKCLGKCGQGANIMIYPDNEWHSQVSLSDVNSLAEKYLTSE